MSVKCLLACIGAQILFIAGCSDNKTIKIKQSIFNHVVKEAHDNSLQLDSIAYSLADSTVYYNHILGLLDQKSESFSKMARLRTRLAQSNLNDFLAGDKKAGSSERNKIDVDKSLEDLKQNEREWNIINDSMDLVLNAIHTTDTSNKIFYEVSFISKTFINSKNFTQSRKAILNKDDFKVVFIE